MSIDVTERPGTDRSPDGAADEQETAATTQGRWRSARRWLGYLGTPLLVTLACGLLYLYVQGIELDSIEQRILTARNLRAAAVEHVAVSLWSTGIVLATAIPVGIAMTRPWAQRVSSTVVGIANIGQGVPAIGTLVLAFLLVTRRGRNAAIIGLVIYCFLPVLRATMVGLRQVDPGVIKAARGMGLSRGQTLVRVELPLAVPILLTGVRTALVLNVSTAPLAAFVGGGTFGRIILGGFSQSRAIAVTTGAVLAASLALIADWLGSIAEDALRPRGL